MAKKKKVIQVKEVSVTIQLINNNEYLSLTDMAKSSGSRPEIIIQRWLRNRGTLEFLILWENEYNPFFNHTHLGVIREKISLNHFTLSVKKWIEQTGAIGVLAKAGRYGGTFAHRDIAFEFATWLSAEFKFYLIKEYQRLKSAEQQQKGLSWDLKRELSKINYRLHTETVRRFLIPKDWQGKFAAGGIYANEADIFNMAVFGTTAKDWKAANPEARGNLRDNASELALLVLANLEAINSELIKEKLPAEERFLRLRAIAQYQLVVLEEDAGIKKFLPPENR